MSVDLKKRGAHRKKVKGEKKRQGAVANFKGEFRYNNSERAKGHPSFIIKQEGNYFWSLGITHSPKTRGKENVPLKKSPNPLDYEKNYIRPVAIKMHKDYFGKVLVEWHFCEEDELVVEALFATKKGGIAQRP